MLRSILCNSSQKDSSHTAYSTRNTLRHEENKNYASSVKDQNKIKRTGNSQCFTNFSVVPMSPPTRRGLIM